MPQFNMLQPHGHRSTNFMIIAAAMKRKQRNRRKILEIANGGWYVLKHAVRAVHNEGSEKSALQRTVENAQASEPGNEHSPRPGNNEVVNSVDGSVCEAAYSIPNNSESDRFSDAT